MCAGYLRIPGSRREKAHRAVALQAAGNTEQELTEEQKALLRPHLFWVNIILIVAAIVSLLFSGFAPAVVSWPSTCWPPSSTTPA